MDQNNNKSPVKKSELSRKKRKPLMEKRRRARINASLEQLKKLVLDATRRDSARYSKLEKADILELTVRHLRDIQRNNINYAAHQDPNVMSKFGDGFSECINEVHRYLSSTEGFSSETYRRLMEHLSGCTQKMYPMHPGMKMSELSPSSLTLGKHQVPTSPFGFLPLKPLSPVTPNAMHPMGIVSPGHLMQSGAPTATSPRVLPGNTMNVDSRSPLVSPVVISPQTCMMPLKKIHEVKPEQQRPHSVEQSTKLQRPHLEHFKEKSHSQQLMEFHIRRYFSDKVFMEQMLAKPELCNQKNLIDTMHLFRDNVWRPW